ncbi:hypothetical protein [Spirosoma panaciterrae]|uniref:hypothetical protein n=1 Tax=Spirosoma panaciterrae TaxID=496058 RepID=UPI00036F3A83|nr:hypothetical protein [Spirosoma panaciterrae]
MRRKNDILLKSAFEEAFPDLLRFFFSEADELFDMNRGFEFMDKELSELFPELEKQGGSRFVDMLVKAWLLDGTEEWILVHLEIQGDDTRGFAHRMLQYWYRIYDRYGVDIVALAVFTGGKTQPRPDLYHKSFLGTEITYKYNAYHILDHSESELLAMDNPFALIVLAAQKALLLGKIPEKELGEQRLTIAKALIRSQQYDSEQIRRFLFFLKTFVYIGDPDINRNFDKAIELLTGTQRAMGIIDTIKMLAKEEAREEVYEEGLEKGIEKGIEQGIEQGLEKGIGRGIEQKSIEVVRNLLLAEKFTDAEIANFASVTEEFVRTVKRKLAE